MATLEELVQRLPEPARDLRVNVQAVLAESSLSPAARWGVAYAVALTARHDTLAEALRVAGAIPPEAAEDAVAASALMGMNNVFYRFKHFVGTTGTYAQRPARLRMQRIAKTSGPRADFELYCLAVSAVNGCESCVNAHEKTARDHGATEDQIWDAVRIAAVVNGVATALGGR